MNSFSIIIPTLWRAEEIFELCQSLDRVDCVKEVFIINNNRIASPDLSRILLSPKFNVITPFANTFVSEAWNMGVRASTSNIVCLGSDDVVLDEKLFDYLKNVDFLNIGLLGLQDGAVVEKVDPNKQYEIRGADFRNHGYGCSMFVHRKYYIPIPKTIKIFFNDDFLFNFIKKVHNLPNMVLNCHQRGRVSVSVSSFNHYFESDRQAYAEICKKSNLG